MLIPYATLHRITIALVVATSNYSSIQHFYHTTIHPVIEPTIQPYDRPYNRTTIQPYNYTKIRPYKHSTKYTTSHSNIQPRTIQQQSSYSSMHLPIHLWGCSSASGDQGPKISPQMARYSGHRVQTECSGHRAAGKEQGPSQPQLIFLHDTWGFYLDFHEKIFKILQNFQDFEEIW